MFESISCSHCRLHFSGIPLLGLIEENGEPAILTLPYGSRPLDSDIKKRLPSDFSINPPVFWALYDYLCLDCKTVSTLISCENKNCLQCGSAAVKTSTELCGQQCPVCSIGEIKRNPPSGIHF